MAQAFARSDPRSPRSRSCAAARAAAGAEVYLSPPPSDRTKLLLVDSAWALVGSTVAGDSE